MSAIYLADWAESGYQGMIGDFNGYGEKTDFADGCEILLAYYSYEDYSGEAFVLFRKDGKLFEVNGGHCSCYGLEGQWGPEETTIDALLHRLNSGRLGRGYYDTNEFAEELREVLAKVGA
jgi:hypothetical protein